MVFHPLAMNSFALWRKLYRDSGGIDPRHKMRAWLINLLSPVWAPLRLAEEALYGRALERMTLDPAPLFLLGHWRSGTTHLHNLFSQDPALGFVTTFQTLAPESFILGRHVLQPLIARTMPKKRPMDNLPLGAGLPQEEEMAMCNLVPYSFYVGWYFPERMPELFSRYVLFEGTPENEVREWKAAYVKLLKKAAYVNPGKRLVLKSPTNTGRIPQLLELFPNAKFVHIRRDPYRVYKSTVHLHQKTCDLVGFQHPPRDVVERNVLDFFKRLTQKYETDKGMIPQGNLVEIAYEDLIAEPMTTMAGVYAGLGLEHWEAARPHFDAYLASQAGYERNKFQMDRATIEKVERELNVAIRLGGYHRPEVSV
jgi:hypothetical protein